MSSKDARNLVKQLQSQQAKSTVYIKEASNNPKVNFDELKKYLAKDVNNAQLINNLNSIKNKKMLQNQKFINEAAGRDGKSQQIISSNVKHDTM